MYFPSLDLQLGDRVPVFVRVPQSDSSVHRVLLRQVYDGEPFFTEATIDRQQGEAQWWRATLHVHNPITRYRFFIDRGVCGYTWLTGAGEFRHDVTDRLDFRATTAARPPSWVRDSVAYQVFPDRFARGAHKANPSWAIPSSWGSEILPNGEDSVRQFFGGDLVGVRNRLDHIQELGANLIYLTPIFPAPSSHRYDATSFDSVDPLLGGDRALIELTRAAHDRGMRVIGDITTNHTSSQHSWFTEAQASAESDLANLYYFRDHPHEYAAWDDLPHLPKLNWTAPRLRELFIDGPEAVISRLLRPPFSLDGWRVDAANMTGRFGKDDLAHEVAVAIRTGMRTANPDSFLVGEHNHDSSADLDLGGWDAIMNYAGFTRPVWSWLVGRNNSLRHFGHPRPWSRVSGVQALESIREWAGAFSWSTQSHSINLVGSHDTPRIRTVVGNDRAAVEVAMTLLFTFPGVPMIFMGDEWGLQGSSGDFARTPMPWADDSQHDDQTMQAIKSLSRVRADSPALRYGGIRWLYAAPDVLLFARETPNEQVLVQVARGPYEPFRLPLAALGPVDAIDSLYGGEKPDITHGGLQFSGRGPVAQVWGVS